MSTPIGVLHIVVSEDESRSSIIVRSPIQYIARSVRELIVFDVDGVSAARIQRLRPVIISGISGIAGITSIRVNSTIHVFEIRVIYQAGPISINSVCWISRVSWGEMAMVNSPTSAAYL